MPKCFAELGLPVERTNKDFLHVLQVNQCHRTKLENLNQTHATRHSKLLSQRLPYCLLYPTFYFLSKSPIESKKVPAMHDGIYAKKSICMLSSNMLYCDI